MINFLRAAHNIKPRALGIEEWVGEGWFSIRKLPEGEEQAELEGGVKCVISLESLRCHKRSKSSPREFY